MYYETLKIESSEIWNGYLKKDKESKESSFGAEARILQEKKLLFWITKDDREAKMNELNNQIESFKKLLQNAGVSFQEHNKINYAGSPRGRDYNGWERVEVVHKYLTYTVSPEQRLTYLKEVCTSPQLVKTYIEKNDKYGWYERFTSNKEVMDMASKAAEKLVECILAEAPYSEKGWEKEQSFYCGALHICPYSLNAKSLSFQWRGYDDDDWVRYEEYGFEPLEDTSAKGFMAVIVAEKACDILSHAEGVEAACMSRLDSKTYDDSFEGVICSVQAYFHIDDDIRTTQTQKKQLKAW